MTGCTIRVDTGSVQQLATAPIREVHGNLEPHVGQVYEGYTAGTAFGRRSPSAELHGVRARGLVPRSRPL
jgi:hypothetical protein